MNRKKFHSHLFFWVFVAVLLGILNGYYFPAFAQTLKPVSDAFMKLIRMMIAPVIFTCVVIGIAGMNNLKRLGRIGLKSFVYFEIMTTFALFLGWTVAKVFRPGEGMNINLADIKLDALQSTLDQIKTHHGVVEFFLNIIPKTIIGAFAEGDVIQVLFVSVLFGIAIAGIGEPNKPVIHALEQIYKALMRMLAMIIRLAPLALFAAMSYNIAKFGLRSLEGLANLLACVYLTCFCFVFICLGSLLYANGLNIFKFIKYLREELLIVFSAGSSEPVLPRVMDKLEALGCPRPLVGVVVPASYSFNLDGSSIYLTMGALFIAQATNTHLTFTQELTVLLVSLLTSKGAAAVVGSAFITLTATLSSLGTIPVEGMILVLSVDWFLAQARAMTNMVGAGVATIVVARWENEFDRAQARAVLNGEEVEPAPPKPATPEPPPSIQTAVE